MKRTQRVRIRFAMLAGLLACASAAASAEALLLYNGQVYTANTAQPEAQAVIAVDGRIAFVGDTATALTRAPASARRIDLAGRALYPGFTDSHAHLEGIGLRELEFDLAGTASLADLKKRLTVRAAATKSGDWLTGRGWIESRWSPAIFPTRQDLDEAVRDRAVVLERADGHALVANSLALERAGINRKTVAPAGGEILKDPGTGEPTGMLIDNAMTLLLKVIPPHDDAQILQALEVGAARSVRLGWTELQNAGSPWREIDLLCRLYREGRVKLRVYGAVGGPGPDAERVLKEGPSIHRCDDRFTVRGIKLYIDGALGSRGAALLAPYSDSPGSQGLLVNPPDVLYPILVQALRRGIQIETHAIGDRGNRIMLDLYERAMKEVPAAERAVAEPRWRIEHAQILNVADIPRFRELGVIASMQPSHAIGDMYFAPKRLGPDRLKGAYAWRSLLDSGAVVVAGSDAPVEVGDPRIEFYAAVARRSLEGFAGDDWHLEERVSREQALTMLTLAPAYAAFEEKERGSIEVGKQADFSAYSLDLMRVSEAHIMKSDCVLTVIGGEIVFSRSP